MSMKLGYLIGTLIFAAIFLIAVSVQIRSPRFHPVIYWITIIATTTVGTTLADFADRSLGIGYAGGASLLFILLMASLAIWHKVMGSVSVNTVSSPKSEMFYWITIMFSQTLGTALGDWTADTQGLGYGGGVGVFSLLLAVVGDFLDKPVNDGGLALSRLSASGALLVFIIACLMFLPHRASRKAH